MNNFARAVLNEQINVTFCACLKERFNVLLLSVTKKRVDGLSLLLELDTSVLKAPPGSFGCVLFIYHSQGRLPIKWTAPEHLFTDSQDEDVRVSEKSDV